MSVSLINPGPVAATTVIFAIGIIDQVIVTPGLLAGVYVKVSPEHIAVGVSVLVNIGAPFIVKITAVLVKLVQVLLSYSA